MAADLLRRAAARVAAAVATISPAEAARNRLRACLHADGRTSYPEVVRYQVKEADPETGVYRPVGPLMPLPPTAESHPDANAAAMAARSGKGALPVSLPYVAVVHDLPAYDALKARGLLEIGHRVRLDDIGTPVDRRPAPGA
ncbi:hypothetical protein [Azospirillum picis]|uniref:Uncharacterized protein n=1 Tax=Azospirillum picis TaxID=488438 RepID=A0ABU0MRV7_9PROT|nr:hypothetical protein [Azospirillum picis]MBP2302558.1 hypothetical protein [Azospirillum picis]MDQ0536200.1 hypothetical protein [Azospirillum picis]